MSIRVVIVEDDHLIREAFTLMLQGAEGIDLLGSFNDAEKFMSSFPALQPDVVLMDIQLPGMSGLECIRRLKATNESVQFLVCSVFEDEENIFRALKAGATGYIIKNVRTGELIRYIHEIYNGQSPMSGPIARKVIGHFRQPRMNSGAEEVLSRREKELLELLAEGLRYKEIAARVDLSPETVRTHIRNIYIKLQVDNRTEAINKAYGR